MVDVEFVEPGADFEFPKPAKKAAHYFDPETRSDFLSQLKGWASRGSQNLFVAKEKDRLVAIGLTRVAQVLSMQANEVRLSDSHARHLAPQGTLTVGCWYEVAVDPASNAILAARETAAPSLAAAPRPTSRYYINPHDLPAVSPADVQAFFSKVRRQPHIPFQFPSDGCWARANEMGRLIEKHFDPNPQTVVAKVWNIGALTVKTENNPECEVNWDYHVAPVVKVGTDLLVLDPSLFERPVGIAEWQKKQGNPVPTPVFTTRKAYNWAHDKRFFGERAGETQRNLRRFQGDLLSMIFTSGPLPYPCGGG